MSDITAGELLPCPFCRHHGCIVTNQKAGKRVSCFNCHVRGPLVPILSKGLTAHERAIIAWNTRK